jgi:hypothetical protein
LSGEVLDKELSYWRCQLHDSPQLIEFAVSRSQTTTVNAKAKTVSIAVDERYRERTDKSSRSRENHALHDAAGIVSDSCWHVTAGTMTFQSALQSPAVVRSRQKR